jgi:aminopeptidase N
MNITHAYDAAAGKYQVSIAQTQEGKDVARVFRLPMAVDIYENNTVRRENIVMTQRNQVFTFDCKTEPNWVNVEADKVLLCQKEEVLAPAVTTFKYRNGPRFRDRNEVLDGLEGDSPIAADLLKDVLQDKYHGIRLRGLSMASPEDPAVMEMVAKLAETETEPSNRATALNKLGQSGDKRHLPLIKKFLGDDQAYSVVNAAFSALNLLEPESAMAAALRLEEDPQFLGILAELYAVNPSKDKLPFFEKKLAQADNTDAFAFFDNFSRYLLGLGDPAVTDANVEKMNNIALNADANSEWRRFSATKCIADIRNGLRERGNTDKADALQGMIEAIKAKETDPTLKLYYDMF